MGRRCDSVPSKPACQSLHRNTSRYNATTGSRHSAGEGLCMCSHVICFRRDRPETWSSYRSGNVPRRHHCPPTLVPAKQEARLGSCHADSFLVFHAGRPQTSACSGCLPNRPATNGSLQRSTRTKPLNSIPASKIKEAAAVLASCQSPEQGPVTPQSGSQWSTIVHSLKHSVKTAPTAHTEEQLICLAESLNALSEAELSAVTADPAALAGFLHLISASSASQQSNLYSHIAQAFLRPQLQEAVAIDPQLSSAADAVVATATHVCGETFWHPDAVVSAASLQLVFCRGHRAFWNLLTEHTDAIHECDAASLCHLAECAAALRVRHPALWTHLATSTNTLALHMSANNLHACVRALGATVPSPPAATAARDSTPVSPVEAVDLDGVMEAVQWRGGQGGCDPADLPYTALAASAILFQGLPDAPAGGQMAAEAACMAERAPAFWQALVRQSRAAYEEGYGSGDALTMALACVAAERYFGRLHMHVGQPGGEGWGFPDGGSEAHDERRDVYGVCRGVLREHAAEMMRFAALVAAVEGDSGERGVWEVGMAGDRVADACQIECMEVWLGVLVGCAGATVPLGADLLPGAARALCAMHGLTEFDSGVAVAALVRVAATEHQAADDQHRKAIERLVSGALQDAAAKIIFMGPMHAIEVLQIVAREFPSAASEPGDEPADTVGVMPWLLGETKGQLAGLSEAWLTRFLRAVAAMPGGLGGYEEVAEELRACLQSKTFTPRNCYEFSGVVNREFFADVRRELVPEDEGFTPQWRSAHGHNASGFTPAEAAEAARCCVALRLFDGGSAVLEALLAASMGGAAAAAAAPRQAPDGGLQAAFQQLLQDDIDRLGGIEIKWIAEQPGDTELLSVGDSVLPEITRESDGVYSALAAASMGSYDSGLEGGSAGCEEGCVAYRFEGWYDGEGAEKVSRVMDETGCAVLEVMEALERADWDAEVAVEMLREAEEAAQAIRGAQLGNE